jgi:single-strand DNA-binding protein
MSSLNKATLLGHLGKDPDIKSSSDGREICSFSIATTENWTDKRTSEKKSYTEWHNIAVFNQNIIKILKQYVKKGSKIYLEGKIKTEKYKDNNGVEKYSTKIIIGDFDGKILLLDNKNNFSDNSSISSGNYNSSREYDIDDEIPF